MKPPPKDTVGFHVSVDDVLCMQIAVKGKQLLKTVRRGMGRKKAASNYSYKILNHLKAWSYRGWPCAGSGGATASFT